MLESSLTVAARLRKGASARLKSDEGEYGWLGVELGEGECL